MIHHRRPGGVRAVNQAKEIENGLVALYGRQRVVPFWGNISMTEAHELVGRALLLVGPHGAGMTNVMFMRPGAAVLELRPKTMRNPCYHYLSDRCDLDFYLLKTNGTFVTAMDVDVKEVLGLVRKILPTEELEAAGGK